MTVDATTIPAPERGAGCHSEEALARAPASCAARPPSSRRSWRRSPTTLERRLGTPRAAGRRALHPDDDALRPGLPGVDENTPCTLVIATSNTARLIVVAGHAGRPLDGGILLEERARGFRLGLEAHWAPSSPSGT